VASGALVEAVETAAGEDVTGGGQHVAWRSRVQGSATEVCGQGEDLEDVPVRAVAFGRLGPEVTAAPAGSLVPRRRATQYHWFLLIE
jgi:hypothetical protein